MAVLAEPDEFYRGAVMHDHGCADAFGRRSGGTDDVLTLESGLEVIHFEGDMRHCLDEIV
jgi:hypothetical protein